MAGANLCATWFSGWLNGVIATAQPSGSRRVKIFRLPLRRDVARENLTVVPQRLHRRESQHVRRPPHLVACFAEAKSGFRQDQLGELLATLLQQPPGAIQHFRASVARRRGAKFQCRRDCRLRVGLARQGHCPRQTSVVRTFYLETVCRTNFPARHQTMKFQRRRAHNSTPFTAKSKMSKLRGSPAALAA